MIEEEFIPTFTHATERDIDILLVEEIKTSEDFQRWLANNLNFTDSIISCEVLHSKRCTRNRREIDIHVKIKSEQHKNPVIILIENKLDAEEQPDQAESYREELEKYKKDSSIAHMALICPSSYKLEHSLFSSKFDAVICYEDIINFLKSRAENVTGEVLLRLQFRIKLLEQALNKHRRGYTQILNEKIGSFNQSYVALLKKLAPDIYPGPTMLKEANPDESVSMIFNSELSLKDLSEDIRPRRFSHEFGKNEGHRANYVAVTFQGLGTYYNEIIEKLKKDTLDYGFAFTAKKPNKNRPNPGLVMSIETCPVDNQSNFESQQPYVEMGIRSAIRLKSWLINNQPIIKEWFELAKISDKR